MANYGENLRNARIKAGMTQSELAEKTSTTQAMIAQCERGSKTPTVGLAVLIAETLGTTCEELVNGKENVNERTETV